MFNDAGKLKLEQRWYISSDNMIRYKFSRQINQEFAVTLKKRVNDYFKESELSLNGNSQMAFKSILALGSYFTSLGIVIFSGTTNLWLLFGLYIFMGFSAAFIGTAVMHDALHSSFSKNKWVNRVMGISAVMLGADPNMWKFQHNVLHHTYTNIEHADEDIASRYIFRFTPNQPKRWFHRYQHIYAVFFYGISTMLWVSYRDFVKIVTYRKMGLIKSKKEFSNLWVKLVVRKLVYYGVFIVLPIVMTPLPFWLVLVLWATMMFIAGLMLSLIFQSAHVVPTTSFVAQESAEIEENWVVHQIVSTSNFAMHNKVLSWLIGGLNYQVEHHLFPHICHVHYPGIAKIVQETTKEFDLPYYAEKTFFSAVMKHFKMLRALGKMEKTEKLVTA